MAIAWLTVLKMVPWGEVINNAPKVADGAKKLWSTVAKKPPAEGLAPVGAQRALSLEAQAIATLQAEVADLHHQMLESSALIRALADQNTQLIKRVEVSRIRVLWLAGIVLLLGVVAAINLAITFAR